MRNFRNRLARIRTLLQDSKIPDNPDLFGVEGITKAMLLATINDLYALSNEIETREASGQFEVVMLKAFEARTHDALKDFLEGLSGTPKKEKFLDFLEKLSKLYERTKQVYFIVNKNGLRDETEIANLRAQIKALTEDQQKVEALLSDLSEKAEAATQQSRDIETALATATDTIKEQSEECTSASTAVKAAHGEVVTAHGAITELHSKVTGWDAEITENLEDAKRTKTAIDGLMQKLDLGITNLNNTTESAKALDEVTKETHQEIRAMEQEVLDTLANANRKGMASSFQIQMDAMKKAQSNWQWVFISTITVFLIVSGLIVTLHLSGDRLDWRSALSRLPLLTPIIWLAWFAARQYSLANRVREDYAFKYSTAMAYEGYKKAVREAAPDLEHALIEVAMANMALNPVRLYDPKNHDHATPVEGMLDKILGRFKKVDGKVTKDGAAASLELTQDK